MNREFLQFFNPTDGSVEDMPGDVKAMFTGEDVEGIIGSMKTKRGRQKKKSKGEPKEKIGLKQTEHRKQFFDFIKRVWSILPCSQAPVFDFNPLAYRLRSNSYDEVVTMLSKKIHKFLFRGLKYIKWQDEDEIFLLTSSGNYFFQIRTWYWLRTLYVDIKDEYCGIHVNRFNYKNRQMKKLKGGDNDGEEEQQGPASSKEKGRNRRRKKSVKKNKSDKKKRSKKRKRDEEEEEKQSSSDDSSSSDESSDTSSSDGNDSSEEA